MPQPSLFRQLFLPISIILFSALFASWGAVYLYTNGIFSKTTFLLILTSITILTIAIVYVVTKRISQPIEQVILSAQQFAEGEMQHELTISESSVANRLSKSLQQIVHQLQNNIERVVNQRNELEALLSSMNEGVIAVDNDGYILRLNRAAMELLSIEDGQYQNHLLIEVVRNTELQKFVQMLLSDVNKLEVKIAVTKENKTLQTHGSWLIDSYGSRLGAVIVLNDISRIEKLEKIRSEFVSNVSHELKTPITTIRGYVETLKEIAFDDKETALKFLDTVLKQTERLSLIVEDLLYLSRIEREGQSIQKEEINLAILIKQVMVEFQEKAKQAQVEIKSFLPENLILQANSLLVRQAFVNLLDNALKYGADGKEIIVRGELLPSEIQISIQDFGQGIDEEHHERIFERFYRVDTARSRSVGGTGLGLAIVKHIVQDHHGYVEIVSQPKFGSTFILHFPEHTLANSFRDVES